MLIYIVWSYLWLCPDSPVTNKEDTNVLNFCAENEEECRNTWHEREKNGQECQWNASAMWPEKIAFLYSHLIVLYICDKGN